MALHMYDICDDQLFLDEPTVRRIQRQANVLHRKVIGWASRVLTLLPSRLPISPAETEILKLYLAQQRRLNLELDGQNGHHGLLARIASAFPFLTANDDPRLARASHQLACSYLQHQIEDATDRFCGQHSLSPTSQPVIDWRVAIRYMAQRLHHIACRINLRNDHYLVSPLKFELALLARQAATDIADKRGLLLDSVETAASS